MNCAPTNKGGKNVIKGGRIEEKGSCGDERRG